MEKKEIEKEARRYINQISEITENNSIGIDVTKEDLKYIERKEDNWEVTYQEAGREINVIVDKKGKAIESNEKRY